MNINETLECPVCKEDWDGGNILEFLTKQRDNVKSEMNDILIGKTDEEIYEIAKSYGYTYENKAHFRKNMIDIEISGVYEGVLYHRCNSCRTHWHRFNGKQYTRDEYYQIKDHTVWKNEKGVTEFVDKNTKIEDKELI
jgi:hypothetical protein